MTTTPAETTTLMKPIEKAPEAALGAGTKNDLGKLRYDLIPPGALEEFVKVWTMGAKKYGDFNWAKGMAWSRIFGAMMRHAWAWMRGERNDPVDGQHHLSSVAWCAFVLMEYERIFPEGDDRFFAKLKERKP